jgi:hypothetical protein
MSRPGLSHPDAIPGDEGGDFEGNASPTSLPSKTVDTLEGEMVTIFFLHVGVVIDPQVD